MSAIGGGRLAVCADLVVDVLAVGFKLPGSEWLSVHDPARLRRRHKGTAAESRTTRTPLARNSRKTNTFFAPPSARIALGANVGKQMIQYLLY